MLNVNVGRLLLEPMQISEALRMRNELRLIELDRCPLASLGIRGVPESPVLLVKYLISMGSPWPHFWRLDPEASALKPRIGELTRSELLACIFWIKIEAFRKRGHPV